MNNNFSIHNNNSDTVHQFIEKNNNIEAETYKNTYKIINLQNPNSSLESDALKINSAFKNTEFPKLEENGERFDINEKKINVLLPEEGNEEEFEILSENEESNEGAMSLTISNNLLNENINSLIKNLINKEENLLKDVEIENRKEEITSNNIKIENKKEEITFESQINKEIQFKDEGLIDTTNSSVQNYQEMIDIASNAIVQMFYQSEFEYDKDIIKSAIINRIGQEIVENGEPDITEEVISNILEKGLDDIWKQGIFKVGTDGNRTQLTNEEFELVKEKLKKSILAELIKSGLVISNKKESEEKKVDDLPQKSYQVIKDKSTNPVRDKGELQTEEDDTKLKALFIYGFIIYQEIISSIIKKSNAERIELEKEREYWDKKQAILAKEIVTNEIKTSLLKADTISREVNFRRILKSK